MPPPPNIIVRGLNKIKKLTKFLDSSCTLNDSNYSEYINQVYLITHDMQWWSVSLQLPVRPGYDILPSPLCIPACSSLPESKDHTSVCFLRETARFYCFTGLLSPPDSTQLPLPRVLGAFLQFTPVCVCVCVALWELQFTSTCCFCVSWRIDVRCQVFFSSVDGTSVTQVRV